MNLLSFEQSLVNKKIFITGHTGFTGGWICLWLQSIGANIAGFSLLPNTLPALFEVANVNDTIASTFADICDFQALLNAIEAFQPEIILHLAAQPLVCNSYVDPMHTFLVNTQGTVHVLEAARRVSSVRAVLCITTDKVYKNNEWLWPYRENDALGGNDPYSASKAAAEMVIQGYSASYPYNHNGAPAIAVARGGNIIGGGDWSENRLIPDFVRAVTNETTLQLRYPNAVRPWQHVLALVQGYMMLMSELLSDNTINVAQAWNFGPVDTKQYSVSDMIELLSANWQRPNLSFINNSLPEANLLALDSSMARVKLNWVPAWDTKQSIAETASWYREYYAEPTCARMLTLNQIENWRISLRKIYAAMGDL